MTIKIPKLVIPNYDVLVGKKSTWLLEQFQMFCPVARDIIYLPIRKLFQKTEINTFSFAFFGHL